MYAGDDCIIISILQIVNLFLFLLFYDIIFEHGGEISHDDGVDDDDDGGKGRGLFEHRQDVMT